MAAEAEPFPPFFGWPVDSCVRGVRTARDGMTKPLGQMEIASAENFPHRQDTYLSSSPEPTRSPAGQKVIRGSAG